MIGREKEKQRRPLRRTKGGRYQKDLRFEILGRTGSGTERSGKNIVRRVFVFGKMLFTSNQLKRYLRANILIL